MRIEYRRSGGFAGLRLTRTIDSEDLPPEEASKLRRMVDTSGFFNLPPEIKASGRGADRFQYKVSIESEGKTHTVVANESAMPSELASLIKWLDAAARKK